MTQPTRVTVGPNLAKRRLHCVVGVVGMVGGIITLSLLAGGLGPITAWACAAAVSLGIVSFVVGAARPRPRVVITPHGFAIDKFIGSECHKWEDIDGQFVVTKAKTGWWGKVVGYRLAGEFETRAIEGDYLSSPEALAALLNEHKQRSLTPPPIQPKR